MNDFWTKALLALLLAGAFWKAQGASADLPDPHLSAAVRSSIVTEVTYEGQSVSVAGRNLYPYEVSWNATRTEMMLSFPRSQMAEGGVQAEGQSSYVTHVSVEPSGTGPGVTIKVGLSQPSTHTGYVTGDASLVRILLTPVSAQKGPPDDEMQSALRPIRLNHGEAEEVGRLLRNFVPLGERAIQVDERLNTIILDTTVDRTHDIERLIRSLDRPADQIAISAQIVEIHADAAAQVGLSLSPSLSTRFMESSEVYGQVPIPIQAFVRSPLEVMATVDMLKEQGKAKVLANPRIVTIDGQPAVVRTEERFPVFVTQFSGDQAFRVKQDIIAGITLSITPRHSGNGEITTAIKTEVTSITGTTSEGYPTTSSREAETIIRVQSGETIVIGGLLEQRQIQRDRKLPLLGELPLIGRLFTSSRTEAKETELFIIVTPYLLEER
ncbi:MAG TPA: secretin N-terminal domain-containing protein [Limnochordales bacterium]